MWQGFSGYSILASEFPKMSRSGNFLSQFLALRAKMGQIYGKMPMQNAKTEIFKFENLAIASYRNFPSATPKYTFSWLYAKNIFGGVV